MSHTPTRRLSTGGLPPIKIREQYVIEEAPSHDNICCFTAWIRKEIVKIPEGWSHSDYPDYGNRTEWSIQIYDTTPQSDNPNHLKALAETLHRETREEREGHGRGEPDRIDVWGMPLAVDISDEGRIAKCKSHHLAEIASRKALNIVDFHIPVRPNWMYERAIIIIDRPEALWDKDEGGFLAVYWDMIPSVREQFRAEYGEDHRKFEVKVSRYTRAELGEALKGFRDNLF
jgi:hypothetical protein